MPHLLFLFCHSAGAALGWWQAGVWGAVAGIGITSWLWHVWHHWCGQRVLAWLRQSNPADIPSMRGMPDIWAQTAGRAARLLRQSQQREQASDARVQDLLAALQAWPDGIILLDAQSRIEWCNQTAQGHFAIELPRDARQAIGNLLREPELTAWHSAGDYSHGIRLSGSGSQPMCLSVHLYTYAEGRLLLLSRDITALEQASTMRRDFVANVSHEIRTPLTVLMGFVETLQTLPLGEAERNRYLGLMQQQARRMHHLVQDLLTLSRLEETPPPDMSGRVSVADWLLQCGEEARALSATLFTQGAQHFCFPTPEELRAAGQIVGSASELHSALTNLLSNAVRYTPADGHISVAWQKLPEGGARLSVSDTGCGISPEHLPRITERFYRPDHSRKRDSTSSGTGLGLSIVRHVLQRHGSTLHIHSVPGQGSTFRVEFPPERIHVDAAESAPPV